MSRTPTTPLIRLCSTIKYKTVFASDKNGGERIKQQESIPAGCQSPACRPYVFHNEQIWTCPGNTGGGALYRGVRSCTGKWGPVQGGSLYGEVNTSWVMVTFSQLHNQEHSFQKYLSRLHAIWKLVSIHFRLRIGWSMHICAHSKKRNYQYFSLWPLS